MAKNPGVLEGSVVPENNVYGALDSGLRIMIPQVFWEASPTKPGGGLVVEIAQTISEIAL